jgi:hypothetical protein
MLDQKYLYMRLKHLPFLCFLLQFVYTVALNLQTVFSGNLICFFEKGCFIHTSGLPDLTT